MDTLDRNKASNTLNLIASGMASFESKAQLENHLLNLLRRNGMEGVSAFLKSLPNQNFEHKNTGLMPGQDRYVAAGGGGQRLVITTFLGPHSASVSVDVESNSDIVAEPDPRHRAFYGIWESLLGLDDSEIAGLDTSQKAVFYIGLLEAEVMNGGLGQYLSNTNGVHLDATLRCLSEIGAARTASILAEAAQLGSSAESFTVAWDSNTEVFEKLDEKFLASGEDLAGLTADTFLDKAGGNGPA